MNLRSFQQGTHCMKKFGPLIDWCPLGEEIECLTQIPKLAVRIQATACMLNESFRVLVLSSSNLEINGAHMGVTPWVVHRGWFE